MKAVIVNEKGQVLILREAATYGDGTNRGRYHMPGGRLEAGEPYEDGLRREIREETGLEIDIDGPVYVGEWRPVIRDVPHQIVGVFFVCRVQRGAEVKLSTEHDQYLWIDPAKRGDYDLMGSEGEAIDRYLASKTAVDK